MSTNEDPVYEVGTLLDAQSDDPILDTDGNRILIAEDQLAGETYPVEGGATILADDPDTDVNEAGWIVDTDGNRIEFGDEGSGSRLAEGSYTVVTQEAIDEGEFEDADPDDDSADGEGEGTDIPESTGTVGTPNQYGLLDSLEQGEDYFGSDPQVTVAGTTIPGVIEVTQRGEGRRSQYLRETQVSGSSNTEKYDIDEDADAGEGGQSGGDETPPLALDIRAYVASSTYEALESLRRTPATVERFDVEYGKGTLEDCELVDLSRSMTGMGPGQDMLYEVEFTVREYRRYEVIDTRPPTTGGDGTDGTDGTNDGTTTAPSGDYVTEVVEWVDRNNDGVVEGPEGQAPPEVQTVGSLNESLSGGQALENIHCTGNAVIRTNGNGWAIRNVGVEGPIQRGSAWLNIKGSGIIENVYFQGPSGGAVGSGAPGIFVHPDCTGPVLIRFAHVRGFNDNGIYASAVGNGPSHTNTGAGAVVTIERCYCENNTVADYRLGTDGSSVRDSVSVNNAHRSMWAYYEHTEAINCDFDGRIQLGGNAHDKMKGAQLTLTNCRVAGGVPGGVNGSSQGSPNLGIPDEVPTSAEEAANGRYYSSPPG